MYIILDYIGSKLLQIYYILLILTHKTCYPYKYLVTWFMTRHFGSLSMMIILCFWMMQNMFRCVHLKKSFNNHNVNKLKENNYPQVMMGWKSTILKDLKFFSMKIWSKLEWSDDSIMASIVIHTTCSILWLCYCSKLTFFTTQKKRYICKCASYSYFFNVVDSWFIYYVFQNAFVLLLLMFYLLERCWKIK
jgi:hypothetical protein